MDVYCDWTALDFDGAIIRIIRYTIRMKTKLTLSVDTDLVQFAHEQAQREQRSVSSMVSDYLMVQKSQVSRASVKRIDAMVGALKQYKIDDSKAAIRSAYAQKHLR